MHWKIIYVQNAVIFRSKQIVLASFARVFSKSKSNLCFCRCQSCNIVRYRGTEGQNLCIMPSCPSDLRMNGNWKEVAKNWALTWKYIIFLIPVLILVLKQGPGHTLGFQYSHGRMSRLKGDYSIRSWAKKTRVMKSRLLGLEWTS